MGTYWIIGFAATAAVVVIVVVLLLGIIYQTNRIIKLAGVAIGAVEQIEQNTKPIWMINRTNATATSIAAGFEELDQLLAEKVAPHHAQTEKAS